PASTRSVNTAPGGRMAVTPVRTGPLPTTRGPSPQISVVCPTRTPATSVMAFSGPVGNRPRVKPSWRSLLRTGQAYRRRGRRWDGGGGGGGGGGENDWRGRNRQQATGNRPTGNRQCRIWIWLPALPVACWPVA